VPQVAANCILPAHAQGYEIGGLEGKRLGQDSVRRDHFSESYSTCVFLPFAGTCIFMDLDLKFDVLCLITALSTRLRSALHDLNECVL